MKAAILCRMTFDVDNMYLSRVLRTSDDLKTWAECSMHVRNSSPGVETPLSSDLRRLRLRDMKLSHALCSTVRQMAIQESSGVLIEQLYNSGEAFALDLDHGVRWSIRTTAGSVRKPR